MCLCLLSCWNDKILIPEQRPINHLLYSVYVIQLNILWEHVRFGPGNDFTSWRLFFFFFFLIDWFHQWQLPHSWIFWFQVRLIYQLNAFIFLLLVIKPQKQHLLLSASLPCASDAILQNFRLNKIPDCTRRRKVSLRPGGFAGESHGVPDWFGLDLGLGSILFPIPQVAPNPTWPWTLQGWGSHSFSAARHCPCAGGSKNTDFLRVLLIFCSVFI